MWKNLSPFFFSSSYFQSLSLYVSKVTIKQHSPAGNFRQNLRRRPYLIRIPRSHIFFMRGENQHKAVQYHNRKDVLCVRLIAPLPSRPVRLLRAQ